MTTSLQIYRSVRSKSNGFKEIKNKDLLLNVCVLHERLPTLFLLVTIGIIFRNV